MYEKNDYKNWPYRLDRDSMKIWKSCYPQLKGVSKLPIKKQVDVYIWLGLTSHQTFEACLYWQGGKAIQLAAQALLEMADD